MLVYIYDKDTRGKALLQMYIRDGKEVTNESSKIQVADVLYVGITGKEFETTIFKEGSRVYTITNNKSLQKHCQKLGVIYISLYKDPLLKENTYLTTEALIGYLIVNHPMSIMHRHILIVGYGNCGKDIAKKLQALQAHIDVTNRGIKYQNSVLKQGHTFLPLETLEVSKYDYIINTVPYPILTKEILNTKKETCKIYDIASFPYGVKEEDRMDQYYILSNLPTMYAYISAAQLLYKAITKKEEIYVKR